MSLEQEHRAARRERYCDHVAAQVVLCVRLDVSFSLRNLPPYPTHPIEPMDARLKDAKPICWLNLDHAEEEAFEGMPRAAGADALRHLGVVRSAGIVSEIRYQGGSLAHSDPYWEGAVREFTEGKLATYAKAVGRDSNDFALECFMQAMDMLKKDHQAWRQVSGEFFERYAPRESELRDLVITAKTDAEHSQNAAEEGGESVE